MKRSLKDGKRKGSKAQVTGTLMATCGFRPGGLVPPTEVEIRGHKPGTGLYNLVEGLKLAQNDSGQWVGEKDGLLYRVCEARSGTTLPSRHSAAKQIFAGVIFKIENGVRIIWIKTIDPDPNVPAEPRIRANKKPPTAFFGGGTHHHSSQNGHRLAHPTVNRRTRSANKSLVA